MIFALINDRIKSGEIQMDLETAKKNYIKAVNKGLLKVLSKWAIPPCVVIVVHIF